jgi:peptidoglycan/LPS O-acetylase OafA/YrhL
MGDVSASASRWNSLDGVRAMAVALVMATHFGLHATQGQIGVDVFFVLSGFLITSLLLRERDRTNSVSLMNFWRRRALRLFPALGCAIALAQCRWLPDPSCDTRPSPGFPTCLRM